MIATTETSSVHLTRTKRFYVQLCCNVELVNISSRCVKQYGHTETLDTHLMHFPQTPVEVSGDDPLQNLSSLIQFIGGREEYFLKHTIYRTKSNRVEDKLVRTNQRQVITK